MNCPICGQRVGPAVDSTWVIAWYGCPRCGHEWSARIRNGQPDMPYAGDAYVYALPHRERP
jgi:transcription elongation factor Elf1